ncbi:MAG: hypothetical protein ACE5I2_07460 [Anaerolineae bacterium]
MRTKEQGLLTPGDIPLVTFTSIELNAAAHGGDILAAKDCPHCRHLNDVLNEWLANHTVSPEELAELECLAKEAS